MPRIARTQSSSGIYHIMVRGINRQNIFLDSEDKKRYVSTLKKYKEICGYIVYGYCLMPNHIHLLLKEGKDPVGLVMKKIGASYVYWFNKKYDRIGHLFQDRFKSEVIEDDIYLLTALRYIHQNPLKAGMVKEIAAYEWSSYNDYVGQKSLIADPKFILNIFNPIPMKAVKYFKEFMLQENKDRCLDDEIAKKPLPDEAVKAIIKEMVSNENVEALQVMDKKERDAIIRNLRDKDISIRQLVRLTGIGRRIIEKAAYK